MWVVCASLHGDVGLVFLPKCTSVFEAQGAAQDYGKWLGKYVEFAIRTRARTCANPISACETLETGSCKSVLVDDVLASGYNVLALHRTAQRVFQHAQWAHLGFMRNIAVQGCISVFIPLV